MPRPCGTFLMSHAPPLYCCARPCASTRRGSEVDALPKHTLPRAVLFGGCIRPLIRRRPRRFGETQARGLKMCDGQIGAPLVRVDFALGLVAATRSDTGPPAHDSSGHRRSFRSTALRPRSPSRSSYTIDRGKKLTWLALRNVQIVVLRSSRGLRKHRHNHQMVNVLRLGLRRSIHQRSKQMLYRPPE